MLLLTLQKSAVLQVPVAQGSTHWYCWQAVAREQSSSTIHSPLEIEVIYSCSIRGERRLVFTYGRPGMGRPRCRWDIHRSSCPPEQ